jgi:hypothetical protein
LTELKIIDGFYHRIFKGKHGLYGIETIKVEKGKIVDTEQLSPNYPTVTMAQFGKRAMAEAHDLYSKVKMEVAKG